ncbi:hypothetical protein GCM10027053_51690 [Intrasporangium mesophilum]
MNHHQPPLFHLCGSHNDGTLASYYFLSPRGVLAYTCQPCATEAVAHGFVAVPLEQLDWFTNNHEGAA